MAPGLAPVARTAWDDLVGRGKVAVVAHVPTVAEWVALADAMLEVGLDPSAVLDAIELPPGLADVVRAAWTYAASLV